LTSGYGLKTAGNLKAVCEEVKGGEESLVAAGFPKPNWYRDASARYSKDAIKLVHDMGYEIGGFSLNADMGASLPAKTVAARISSAKNGDVIIAHMNQPKRASGQGVATGILELHRSLTGIVMHLHVIQKMQSNLFMTWAMR